MFEAMKLLVVDMSWQFAALVGCIVICLAVTSRIRAEQKSKQQEQMNNHMERMSEKRLKHLEHQAPVNQPEADRYVSGEQG
jgi:membrane protein implicated in regulation of membrane protease activity